MELLTLPELCNLLSVNQDNAMAKLLMESLANNGYGIVKISN